ncbi:MAG: pyridoxal 5'-phosphate synthase glutaminase subunit PdxT [Armatimonadetes bacterium]|nr:pyridoxal 5'-phosphate synthase glutaminase subunit PdxT [Armatimonadota bacterium]
MSKIVGVLSLQGDFLNHIQTLAQLDCEPRAVKTPQAVAECDALVIPGGESTTIGKLMERFGVDEPILQLHRAGKPIWGTCAGMILLAKEIVGSDQWRLGLMDITVERNAFGRQVDSFETDFPVKGIEGGDVRAVFIRAPFVRDVDEAAGVEVLATYEDKIVMCRQGNLLASAFHPELTDDRRVQQYFLDMIT